MRATKESVLHYLKELKAEFSQDGITTFALFGSFAKDTQGVYSDIDVAIAKSSDYLNSDVFDLDSQSPFKETIQNELIYV